MSERIPEKAIRELRHGFREEKHIVTIKLWAAFFTLKMGNFERRQLYYLKRQVHSELSYYQN